MVRTARKRCESGIYHIVLRGINRQDIFYEENDFQRFLETLTRMKSGGEYSLLGYCLMNNHVHLLIRENTDAVSRIMGRTGTSYAWWYNRKYGRTGHVFQGRYGSECVEDDAYLLTVLRYIRNNPVKAGIANRPEDYRWSSIHVYYTGKEHPEKLTDLDLILAMMAQKCKKAIQELRVFTQLFNEDKCLDDNVG